MKIKLSELWKESRELPGASKREVVEYAAAMAGYSDAEVHQFINLLKPSDVQKASQRKAGAWL